MKVSFKPISQGKTVSLSLHCATVFTVIFLRGGGGRFFEGKHFKVNFGNTTVGTYSVLKVGAYSSKLSSCSHRLRSQRKKD